MIKLNFKNRKPTNSFENPLTISSVHKAEWILIECILKACLILKCKRVLTDNIFLKVCMAPCFLIILPALPNSTRFNTRFLCESNYSSSFFSTSYHTTYEYLSCIVAIIIVRILLQLLLDNYFWFCIITFLNSFFFNRYYMRIMRLWFFRTT